MFEGSEEWFLGTHHDNPSSCAVCRSLLWSWGQLVICRAETLCWSWSFCCLCGAEICHHRGRCCCDPETNVCRTATVPGEGCAHVFKSFVSPLAELCSCGCPFWQIRWCFPLLCSCPGDFHTIRAHTGIFAWSVTKYTSHETRWAFSWMRFSSNVWTCLSDTVKLKHWIVRDG